LIATRAPDDAKDTSNDQDEPDPFGNGEDLTKPDSGYDRNI
jgi:hypothetical protein